MAAIETQERIGAEALTPSVVVWINGRHAVLAAMWTDGRISTCEIERGWLSQPAYLAQVVRSIGDRQRIVILGPGSVRSLLEHDYLGTYRRSGRLLDVEPAGPVTIEQLVDRVRVLAS